MIYIKRLLYLLFIVAIHIISAVIFFISVITFPFVAMVDYIMHGKITKDHVMKVCEWLDDISNKFKPE